MATISIEDQIGELRGQIGELRGELRGEVGGLKTRLDDMHRLLMVLIGVAGTGVVAAVTGLILQFVDKGS